MRKAGWRISLTRESVQVDLDSSCRVVREYVGLCSLKGLHIFVPL